MSVVSRGSPTGRLIVQMRGKVIATTGVDDMVRCGMKRFTLRNCSIIRDQCLFAIEQFLFFASSIVSLQIA